MRYILRLFRGGNLINKFYVSLYLFLTAEVRGTAFTPMSSIGNCVFAVVALLTLSCWAGTGPLSQVIIPYDSLDRERETERVSE